MRAAMRARHFVIPASSARRPSPSLRLSEWIWCTSCATASPAAAALTPLDVEPPGVSGAAETGAGAGDREAGAARASGAGCSQLDVLGAAVPVTRSGEGDASSLMLFIKLLISEATAAWCDRLVRAWARRGDGPSA